MDMFWAESGPPIFVPLFRVYMYTHTHTHKYIYIYIYYIPRTLFYPLPLSFRKGSEAALIGHMTEHRGGPAEHGSVVGATAEYGGARPSTGRATGSAA
jgi:hypothetical protein